MSMPTFTDGVVVHATSLNTLGTGITNLNTYILGSPPPRTTIPQCRVRFVTLPPITIADSLNTIVTWNALDRDTDNMFSFQAANQITIRTAGTYALRAEWRWEQFSPNSGERLCWALYNGTSSIANMVALDHLPAAVIGIDGPINHVSTILPGCTVGAPIYFSVTQTNTNGIGPSNSIPGPHMEIWRIGP